MLSADLSYFANVFGRTAVQVSFPVLQASSGLTHAMTASLLSGGAIAQVFGKLINASVISSLGAFKSFILNLGLQIVAYVVMAAPIGGAFNYPRFMAGWVLQMWAASSMWPMMTSLCSDAFEGNGFGRALGILATSSRAGAIIGNMLFGPLSAKVSWQTPLRHQLRHRGGRVGNLQDLRLPAAAEADIDNRAERYGTRGCC